GTGQLLILPNEANFSWRLNDRRARNEADSGAIVAKFPAAVLAQPRVKPFPGHAPFAGLRARHHDVRNRVESDHYSLTENPA
ncbi:MAG: hypothetical protein ACREE3_08760, partial [Stellaceae bacterium]